MFLCLPDYGFIWPYSKNACHFQCIFKFQHNVPARLDNQPDAAICGGLNLTHIYAINMNLYASPKRYLLGKMQSFNHYIKSS